MTAKHSLFPTSAPHLLAVTAHWQAEESDELAEAIIANDVLAQADALLDSLGATICALALFSPDELATAWACYKHSQTSRGRPLDVPHQHALAGLIDAASKLTQEERLASVRILHTRARKIAEGR